MYRPSSQATQANLFYAPLKHMLDPEHLLMKLEGEINWASLERKFQWYPRSVAWPTPSLRSLLGLLMLNMLYKATRDELLRQWVENPYWQYFCGEQEFQWQPPMPSSDLLHFEQAIGEAGRELVAKSLKNARLALLASGTGGRQLQLA
ncbi:MAG: hypothetical protein D6730_16515 [Bacteroidetes bacterium]|nr:MAG: hypothetical protein D6730_16515 [Bacteroidota bacterium]